MPVRGIMMRRAAVIVDFANLFMFSSPGIEPYWKTILS
jgi:hypothetical protein